MLHVDLPEGHRGGQRDNGLCCQGGDAVPGPRVVLGPSTPARAAAAGGHSWRFVRGTGHVLSSENGGAEWDLMERRAVYNRLKHPPPPPLLYHRSSGWSSGGRPRGGCGCGGAHRCSASVPATPPGRRRSRSVLPHTVFGGAAHATLHVAALCLAHESCVTPPPPARAGPSGPSCAVPLPRLWAQA